MSLGFILALCSALVAGAIGLVMVCRSKPSVPHLSFAAGMMVLVFESFCSGLAADALLPDTVAYWETIPFWAVSLLPGTWDCVQPDLWPRQLSEFLEDMRFVLWAAFLVPVTVAIGFREELTGHGGRPEPESAHRFC